MADVPSVFPMADWLDQPWTERLEALRQQSSAPAHLGPYRLLQLLGRGGMGSVYLAERADGRFARQVAIKLLDAGYTISREAAALAKLDHPHIARILDAGSAPDGRHYLVLQYVEGQPLAAARFPSPLEITQCFIALAGALQHAHQRGIVHRDIKPSNILIQDSGYPVLIDFSAAATHHENADQTETLYRAWTPNFASPEQLAGEAGTAQSDIYSLGVVLQSVLPKTAHSRLEADLHRVARKAAEELPALRYHSAAEMARDLEAALDQRPTLARRPRRHKAWLHSLSLRPGWMGLLVLSLALYAAAALAIHQRREMELGRRIQSLSSLSTPSYFERGTDDPRGINRRALLGAIAEWSALRSQYGSRPRILEGLYLVTAAYGNLLMGPTSSRAENFPLAQPHMEAAIRLSDLLPSLPDNRCYHFGHQSDARIALANAYLTVGNWQAASRILQEARDLLTHQSIHQSCLLERDIHALEVDAVYSRILFAQKRWDELIPLRTDLLARREAMADRAARENWSDALFLRVAHEHGRTSLGWALYSSGKVREGYAHYRTALSNLETLHRRAPSMRNIAFRLGKFHAEAAQIATALGDHAAATQHQQRAQEFQDTLQHL